MTIPSERKASKATTTTKSSHFLFFKLNVSQTTVQVSLNNMYFPISYFNTAIFKEIPKTLLSLSDLIRNLCVHRTYNQGKGHKCFKSSNTAAFKGFYLFLLLVPNEESFKYWDLITN